MRTVRKVPVYTAGFIVIALTGLGVGAVISGADSATPPTSHATSVVEDGAQPTDSSAKALTDRPGVSHKGEQAEPVGRRSGTATSAPSHRSSVPIESSGRETPAPAQSGNPQPITATPKPPTNAETRTPETPSSPKPQTPIYQFFLADDSAQNRIWCDTRTSGSVKVVIGTMYRSYYNDNNPANAFTSWGYSKEDETCP